MINSVSTYINASKYMRGYTKYTSCVIKDFAENISLDLPLQIRRI
jgi:hypothetical protein